VRATFDRGFTRAPEIAIACGLASLFLSPLAWAAGPPRASDPVRAVFAPHDCCGRLVHSEIAEIGELRSGSHRLTIYTLWFVNPESHHGMKHLAIVEGRRFLGSYVISDRMIPRVDGNRVRFDCRDALGCPASPGDDLVIVDGFLPQRLWVDGDVSQLDDSI